MSNRKSTGQRKLSGPCLIFPGKSDFSLEPVLFKKLVNNTMHLITGDIPSNIDVEITVPR